MTGARPIEERIAGWLEDEAPGDLPHAVLESAFAEARSVAQDRPIAGPRTITQLIPRRRTAMLLIAAVLASLLGGYLIGSRLSNPSPTPQGPINLLATVRSAGQIRIAVRPDHPQAPVGGVATGFDTDVAAELASRLGLRADIVIVDVPTMLGPDQRTWDVALPSTPDWLIDSSRYQMTTAYYFWPHRLVVPASSAATSLADVAAGPICAVAGDQSESWLRGGYGDRGGPVSTPATTSVLTKATDADCLAALENGDVVAAVTAKLSDAELQALADVRVIGGPDPEPRDVLVHRQTGTEPDPTDLLAAVNDALAAMRADGTLTSLSQRRFGGADLSSP